MTDHDELLAVMQRCADHERTDPHTRYALIKGAEALRAALATRPEPLPQRCWALIADLSETIPTHHTAVAALRERARDLWAKAAAAGSATPTEEDK
jgi:hypothetical protein